jgi:hypothetical protein
MRSAEDFAPGSLKGRKVTFRNDTDHAGCWHARNRVKSGVVLKPAPTLAEKAALLAEEGLAFPEALPGEADTPRLWVRVDPCETFPHGCETAVELGCLLVVEAGKS